MTQTNVLTTEQIALQTKWIEALRSGKYDQATGKLRNTSGFCCLGVLCDVIDPEGWEDDDDIGDGYQYRGYSSKPSTAILDMVGLRGDDVRRYVRMNDEETQTFLDIADKIEYHIKLNTPPEES